MKLELTPKEQQVLYDSIDDYLAMKPKDTKKNILINILHRIINK
jgi:hypothetical protein